MVIKRLASVRTSTDLDSARPSACSAQIQAASPLLLGTPDSVHLTPSNFDENCKLDKRFSLSVRKCLKCFLNVYVTKNFTILEKLLPIKFRLSKVIFC